MEVYNKEPGLRNWTRGGLERRPKQYEKYLRMVCPEYTEWKDFTIADIGCGPMAGVLPFMHKSNKRIPIDPMAKDWAKIHKPKIKIIEGFGEKIPLEDDSCDIVFCMNAIDHTLFPHKFAVELQRILKLGGSFYLYTNLRTKSQIDEGHPVSLKEKQVLNWFNDMIEVYYKVTDKDPTNGSAYKTLLIKAYK